MLVFRINLLILLKNLTINLKYKNYEKNYGVDFYGFGTFPRVFSKKGSF
jgi:hypothetical protein